MGSHMLSLSTLLLFGSFVPDTFTGVRAVRASILARLHCPLEDTSLNHHLLASILADRGEILETPVYFLPTSPSHAKRTGLGDGLRALWTLFSGRMRRR